MLNEETAKDAEQFASDEQTAILAAMKDARQEAGLSQRQLAKLSGVQQPVIARMEQGKTSPQVDTLLKTLYPLDKKLAVVSRDTKGGDTK